MVHINRYKEIVFESDKVQFQRILNFLNNAYDNLTRPKKEDARAFRRIVVKSDVNDLEIKLGKIGDFEYLIFVKNKVSSDSWIHIDGIEMERAELLAKGDEKHPAFEIECISDLFKRGSVIPDFTLDIK